MMRTAVVALMLVMGCGEGTSVVEKVESKQAPSLTIAFQGQGNGEIAPCGCPKNPMGGLTRRNLIIEELRAAGPVVVVEAGNSLLPGSMDVDEAEQRSIKADLIAASYNLVGLDVMGIGGMDWQLGPKRLQELVETHELPVVAANIECEGWTSLKGHRVIERGGWTIGFVGVAAGAPEGCTEHDLEQSVLAEVGRMPEVDLYVLLWGEDISRYSEYSEALQVFDFVIGGQGGSPRPHASRLGKNWTVLPHLRAKQLSLLSLSVTEGATNWGPEGYRAVMKREVERFTERKKSAEELIESGSPAEVKRAQGQLRYVTGRLEKSNGELEDWDKGGTNRNTFVYSHRTLDKTLEEHEATKQLYELALTQIAMLESKGGFMPVKRIVPSDSDSAYAGAHTCIPCHRPQHLQWSSTPHASAYQSLVDENRQMDRECYDCHVTGAGHPDGPSEPGEVGPLQDVQCEACHGPSKVHSLNPVDVKPIRTPPQTTCTACHDGVRDEGRFDWSVYLPRVAHGAK